MRKDENEWELLYVEVIQRRKCIFLSAIKGILRRQYLDRSFSTHASMSSSLYLDHKRTPYATSTFPVEGYSWNCDDAQLYQYGRPHPDDRTSASTYWRVIDNDPASKKVNPFAAPGFPGSCQFPQITRGGLDDSWQHGKDLYGVYHDLLHVIPDTPSELEDPLAPFHDHVRFRVTNNPITSQVAGMLLNGMFGVTSAYPLLIQPKAIDSLEPSYACPHATSIYQSYGPGSSYLTSFPTSSTSSRSRWLNHLTSTQSLFSRLDAISGVDPDSRDWHQSWDHYFDSLSSRLCHSQPLPCNATTSTCIAQAEAEEVFRLGMWEYSHIYRDSPESLEASAAGFGVWLAELSQHLKDAASGLSKLRYLHNVAHDGSVSRLLSILQVENMVWPGLGSEVVFEIFRKKEKEEEQHDAHEASSKGNGEVNEHSVKESRNDMTTVHETSTSQESSGHYYIRILWGGRVLESSHPALGTVDMLPMETFLDYIDDLVGVRASKVKEMCGL